MYFFLGLLLLIGLLGGGGFSGFVGVLGEVGRRDEVDLFVTLRLYMISKLPRIQLPHHRQLPDPGVRHHGLHP